MMSRFKEFLSDVKEFVKGFTPNAEVYLFGSYAEGRAVASSDIDILVIVDEGDRARAEEVKVGVKRKYIDYPIEIHVITKEEFDRWYKRFIGNLIKV
jgi:predicted nucleotidyltransferase